MTLLEREMRTKAVTAFDCPECGQSPGQRCRNATRDWLDRRTLYDYCGPHPERVALAYRSEFAGEFQGGDC